MSNQDALVRYVGGTRANIDYHHGQLRPAVGVHSYQVLRANRSHPEQAEAYGWTYNHAPMLAYWNGRFYLEYLSDPVGEHTPPGQTLLTWSPDGRTWQRPQVVFPPYVVPMGVYPDDLPYKLAPGTYAVMHQRMGFYVAPNGRLLVLGFYGVCPHFRTSPQDGRGIGRVVREVYADNSFGPIHFIRYNRHAGWNESNTSFPFYRASSDAAFVDACEALLADKLITLQWWEEDRGEDGFFATRGREAFCFYHAADGKVVGLWKWSMAALSMDEGQSWSEIRRVPSLVMSGAKVWGQRTTDGRYALVYNPSTHGYHRWPLAVVTGDDGYTFDDMLLVQGEVPPRRFRGHAKDYGPQYVRGIIEGNGVPPDGGLWVTYSMNKEDIWVSRVPVPVLGYEDAPIDEDLGVEGVLERWNIYSPLWARVVVEPAMDGRRALALYDEDPYDYARVERVFPDSVKATIRVWLMAGQTGGEPLYIEVVDERGQAPVRLWFDGDGHQRVVDGCLVRDLGEYRAGEWYDLEITLDVEEHRFLLTISGTEVRGPLAFDASVSMVHRLILRTGAPRRLPLPETPREPGEDLPGADERGALSVYYVARLTTTDHVFASRLVGTT